jgi:hypothetical protein
MRGVARLGGGSAAEGSQRLINISLHARCRLDPRELWITGSWRYLLPVKPAKRTPRPSSATLWIPVV